MNIDLDDARTSTDDNRDDLAADFRSEVSRADREAALRAATEHARGHLSCCLRCGRSLGLFDLIAGRSTHGRCESFVPAPGKGKILLYCRYCEQVTWGSSAEHTDSFGANRVSRKCGQCLRYE